jgi:hypothetical protein
LQSAETAGSPSPSIDFALHHLLELSLHSALAVHHINGEALGAFGLGRSEQNLRDEFAAVGSAAIKRDQACSNLSPRFVLECRGQPHGQRHLAGNDDLAMAKWPRGDA